MILIAKLAKTKQKWPLFNAFQYYTMLFDIIQLLKRYSFCKQNESAGLIFMFRIWKPMLIVFEWFFQLNNSPKLTVLYTSSSTSGFTCLMKLPDLQNISTQYFSINFYDQICKSEVPFQSIAKKSNTCVFHPKCRMGVGEVGPTQLSWKMIR